MGTALSIVENGVAPVRRLSGVWPLKSEDAASSMRRSCSRASAPFNPDVPVSLYRVADRLDDAQFATLLHEADVLPIANDGDVRACAAGS